MWQKIAQSLLIFVYFLIDSRKISITQKWLVVESFPTLRWIAFLMVYWLEYSICSHFNKLYLVWSAYYKISLLTAPNFHIIWIRDKIFEINSSFQANRCTTREVQFLFLISFLLVFKKYLIPEEDWALSYDFRKSWYFLDFS